MDHFIECVTNKNSISNSHLISIKCSFSIQHRNQPQISDPFIIRMNESKSGNTRKLPPRIKAIIEGNPQVCKSELEPDDCINLAWIPGFAIYEKVIKLDIKVGSKPVANYSTRPVPLHYSEPAHKLY